MTAQAALPLVSGDSGPQIADLRRRLAKWQQSAGVQPTLAEGEAFDEEVTRAVRAFQRDRSLPADGVVGSETWKALVEAGYALGDRLLWQSHTMMRGDDVLELQHRLNQLGFDAGVEDGLFGSAVRTAVMEFQANVGLEIDGVVGVRTLAQLQRLHRGHLASGVSARVREQEAVRRLARRGLTGLTVMVDPAEIALPEGTKIVPGAEEIPWGLATRVIGHLGARGARPVLSRGHGSQPPSSDRAALANGVGVDLVVSISLNASAAPEASGCAAYYFGSLRYVSAAGEALATALLDGALVTGIVGPDCRTHPMTWTILRDTKMAAAVIEPGFASNEHDVAVLCDAVNQDQLARALVDALDTFLADYAHS